MVRSPPTLRKEREGWGTQIYVMRRVGHPPHHVPGRIVASCPHTSKISLRGPPAYFQKILDSGR